MNSDPAHDLLMIDGRKLVAVPIDWSKASLDEYYQPVLVHVDGYEAPDYMYHIIGSSGESDCPPKFGRA